MLLTSCPTNATTFASRARKARGSKGAPSRKHPGTSPEISRDLPGNISATRIPPRQDPRHIREIRAHQATAQSPLNASPRANTKQRRTKADKRRLAGTLKLLRPPGVELVRRAAWHHALPNAASRKHILPLSSHPRRHPGLPNNDPWERHLIAGLLHDLRDREPRAHSLTLKPCTNQLDLYTNVPTYPT